MGDFDGSLWVQDPAFDKLQDEYITLTHDGTDMNMTFADITSEQDTRLDRIEGMLEKITDRLAVLADPDPEKLEQFETLKEAYDKYKFVEKLCGEKKEKE